MGYELYDVGLGTLFAVMAGAINTALATWLIRTGRKTNAIILVANGKHVLSDVVTTGAALVGMLIAWLTNLIFIDLIVAALAAFISS